MADDDRPPRDPTPNEVAEWEAKGWRYLPQTTFGIYSLGGWFQGPVRVFAGDVELPPFRPRRLYGKDE